MVIDEPTDNSNQALRLIPDMSAMMSDDDDFAFIQVKTNNFESVFPRYPALTSFHINQLRADLRII